MAKLNNKTHQKRMDKNCHIPDLLFETTVMMQVLLAMKSSRIRLRIVYLIYLNAI